MMNVTNTPCLQRYSDLVVNATHRLSQPNQTVPGWVHTLPEPERSEKIQDVEEYGSPNVFTQVLVSLFLRPVCPRLTLAALTCSHSSNLTCL